MSWENDRRRTALLIAGFLVALLAFQAAAGATAPPEGIASTGRVIGKASFAYVGGIRTFAAAVIWNRLEPVFHKYYSGKSLSQMRWALPAMNLVQMLDPQFLAPYYEASFNLHRMGAKEEGVRTARLGVKNNPQSGFMRANYVQILLMDDKQRNLAEMVKQANVGMGEDMYWNSPVDLYEGLAIFRVAYYLNGDTEKVAAIERRLEEMRESGVEIGSHDHDGDGKPDH